MISQLALIAWIIMGASLFMLTTPTRAFILVYTIGILVLPVEQIRSGQGFIALTYSLRIDKYMACHLAVLIGTIMFCPHVLSRFKFGLIDAIFGIMLAGIFASALVNRGDAKTGVADAVSNLLGFYPAIIFARMYVTNLSELNTVMRTIIGGAVVYGLIVLIEVRFSPQIHRLMYGYFQHSFSQFVRYGFFRPAGMLRHAIELAFFMGTALVMAAGLSYRRMFPPLWGMFPGWMVVGWLGLTLAATFTVSGYLAFFAGAGVLVMLQMTRKRAWLLALPSLALLWMVLRYFGEIDANSIIRLASMVNKERGESLSYRLSAEAYYLFEGNLNPIIGGGTGIVGNGKPAVDAFWLVQIGFYGWLGLLCWLALWMSGIVVLYRKWNFLGSAERYFCSVACAAVAPMFIDFLFNGFPSHFLMITTTGVATAVTALAASNARTPAQASSGHAVNVGYAPKPLSHIATRPIP